MLLAHPCSWHKSAPRLPYPESPLPSPMTTFNQGFPSLKKEQLLPSLTPQDRHSTIYSSPHTTFSPELGNSLPYPVDPTWRRDDRMHSMHPTCKTSLKVPPSSSTPIVSKKKACQEEGLHRDIPVFVDQVGTSPKGIENHSLLLASIRSMLSCGCQVKGFGGKKYRPGCKTRAAFVV